jgi:hypothetical protein
MREVTSMEILHEGDRLFLASAGFRYLLRFAYEEGQLDAILREAGLPGLSMPSRTAAGHLALLPDNQATQSPLSGHDGPRSALVWSSVISLFQRALGPWRHPLRLRQ